MAEITETRSQRFLRTALTALVFLIALFIALIMIYFFLHQFTVVDLVYRHFPSLIGLPCAAAAALFIVLITRAVSGNMNVQLLIIKFEGAASEAIIWVICFLAISYAIEKTWQLEYIPNNPPATFQVVPQG